MLAGDGENRECAFQEVQQLAVMLCTVMVGEHGCDAIREADEEACQQHFGVEDDADGCDTVLARPGERDEVEEERRNADGALRDHF